MATIIAATTPTFNCILENFNLDGVKDVVFSLVQDDVQKINKSGGSVSVSGNTVQVYLKQVDTVKLHKGEAEIQINWIYPDGKRGATDPTTIKIKKNLLSAVIV